MCAQARPAAPPRIGPCTTTMEPPSITAITPFVAYTGMPQQLLGHRPSPTSVGSAHVRKRLANADARMRHGVDFGDLDDSEQVAIAAQLSRPNAAAVEEEAVRLQEVRARMAQMVTSLSHILTEGDLMGVRADTMFENAVTGGIL